MLRYFPHFFCNFFFSGTWEIDQLKRTIVTLENDSITAQETIAMIKRDNHSLKKVEKNMGSFLKSVMGSKGSIGSSIGSDGEREAIVNGVKQGVKPLALTPKNIRNNTIKISGSNTKSGNKKSFLKNNGSSEKKGSGGIRRPGSACSNKKVEDTARSTSARSTTSSRESTSARSINGDGNSNFSLPSMITDDAALSSHRSDKSDSSIQSSESLPSLHKKKEITSKESNKDNEIAAGVIARTAQFLKARQDARPVSRGASASRKRSPADPGRGSSYDNLFQKQQQISNRGQRNGIMNKENTHGNVSRRRSSNG